MAPRVEDQNNNYLVADNEYHKEKPSIKFIPEGDFRVVPLNVAAFIIGNLFWLISVYYVCTASAATWIWYLFLVVFSGLGVTVGAHRLWAHRSYKAKLPLRIFLAMWQSVAGQNCLYVWCRDHRVHHKYSDTDADPHNIRRGAFFAHVGWLLTKKHPEVAEKGKKLSTDDLMADPIVYWQKKFYYPIYFIFAFYLPTMIPVWFWNETFMTSLFVSYIFRTGYLLHSTWFINSAAHMWGDRPYDSSIPPVENIWMHWCSLGESYHNYHHTFPYDYRAGELPMIQNLSRHFIDLMHSWGQAYDLKTASSVSVISRKEKTSDAA